jgi:hypothetical protein
MSRSSLLGSSLLLILAACAATPVETPAESVAAAPSELTLAQFGQLRGLQGDWYMIGADGAAEGDVLLSYRVSSGGSAVIETTFPGQEHEMTTVYTLDGRALVLTHYCAIGNAPHMVAVEEGDASEVHFACESVGNAGSHDDLHMHDAVFRFQGDGRLRSVWTLWGGGKLGGSEEFELIQG